MILTGGDISKINPKVVEKVEQVEQQEGYVATVTLQTINRNIFLCNVVFAKHTPFNPDLTVIAFESLNLYQTESREMIHNMQDGKRYGFEIESFWIDARREFPECPEDFASEVLFDLFIHGWD